MHRENGFISSEERQLLGEDPSFNTSVNRTKFGKRNAFPLNIENNIKTEIVHLYNQFNNGSGSYDNTYLSNIVNCRIIECGVSWASPPSFDDLTIGIQFPSHFRSFETHQPQERNNEIYIHVKPNLYVDDLLYHGFKKFTEFDAPKLDDAIWMKNGIKKNGLHPIQLRLPHTTNNSIDNWYITLEVEYIKE